MCVCMCVCVRLCFCRIYPAETMTNANYVNTPAQAESLLYSQQQAAGDIGLYMNTNKTEFMRFKQERAMSTLSGKPLK